MSYTPLEPLLDTLPTSLPVYGTLLDGTNIYQQDLSSNGIIGEWETKEKVFRLLLGSVVSHKL